MKIGIDLDNTINSNSTTASFFSLLTNLLRHKAEIFIITNRDPDDRIATRDELYRLGIYFDRLIITADKADFIIKNGITAYIDDTDEYFLELPESVIVFKIREPGNFDFTPGVNKWIYGNKTGINIDNRKEK